MNNAFGSIILGTMFGLGAVIDEKSLIPIGSAVAMGCFVFVAGRKFQRTYDRLESIEGKIDNLPCVKGNVCKITLKDECSNPE